MRNFGFRASRAIQPSGALDPNANCADLLAKWRSRITALVTNRQANGLAQLGSITLGITYEQWIALTASDKRAALLASAPQRFHLITPVPPYHSPEDTDRDIANIDRDAAAILAALRAHNCLPAHQVRNGVLHSADDFSFPATNQQNSDGSFNIREDTARIISEMGSNCDAWLSLTQDQRRDAARQYLSGLATNGKIFDLERSIAGFVISMTNGCTLARINSLRGAPTRPADLSVPTPAPFRYFLGGEDFLNRLHLSCESWAIMQMSTKLSYANQYRRLVGRDTLPSTSFAQLPDPFLPEALVRAVDSYCAGAHVTQKGLVLQGIKSSGALTTDISATPNGAKAALVGGGLLLGALAMHFGMRMKKSKR